ncbi:MAG: hypothetical protein ACW96U_11710 [Candidatus Heimdallarchaeaceae archaeon]|jgi:hypothetical protein
MSFGSNQIYPKFKVPKEINKTTKEPVYVDNGKNKIGEIIFGRDGSIGVYIKRDFIDRISRTDLDRRLGRNYTLGVLGRESVNRMKPSKF